MTKSRINDPKIIILFGLAGAGKNYIGEILQKKFDFYFWDGDNVLTSEMQQCIENKEPFTQDMRDQFTDLLIENILILRKKYSNLVVAQALYKEKNRAQILKKIPEVQFILVESDHQSIQKRLSSINSSIDIEYAELIQKNFEVPSRPHATILNRDGDTDLIDQLKALFLTHCK